MRARNYLISIGLTGLLGWITLGIVIFRLDPFTSTALALPFFLAALFLALTGTLGVLGFYGRVWFGSGEIYVGHISIALRQAALVALAVCVAVLFQILRILTWWDAALIIAAVGLVEIYFGSRD